MAKFRQAPEVEEIALDLIHRHHNHLMGANIGYRFRKGDWSKGGFTTWGQAQVTQPLVRFETNLDFWLLINEGTWERLDSKQRVALVDHELCHMVRSEDDQGNVTWGTVGHDLEEFKSVVARHGMWRPSVDEFTQVAAGQLHLLDHLPKAPPSEDGATRITITEAGKTVESTLEAMDQLAATLQKDKPPGGH